ncbi:MAG: hypothetical protein ABH879_02610 [archaeon]
MMPNDRNTEELVKKYRDQIQKELSEHVAEKPVVSREYTQFKNEYLPAHLSLYETLCRQSGQILRVKPDKKKAEELQKSIEACHLNITPAGAIGFSFLAPLLMVLAGGLLGYMLTGSLFLVVFFLIIAVAIISPLQKLPLYLANNWRMKASNQMVISVFYIVTYMRHTSNLENALDFASEHLTGPLALDFKKILWDVETDKYESVKESVDMYLEGWREWNREFIESFHLIESSLYEGSEDRRLNLLDKALSTILDETYENMLHYAQNLKSPVTMLHMLGVILPILGLVILPLVVSFMEGVKWYHIAMLYNILLPIGVYSLGKSILQKRPTGYGDTDISEYTPGLKKYKNIIISLGSSEVQISPLSISVIVFLVLFMIGLSPIILHILYPNFDIQLMGGKFELLGYRLSQDTGQTKGPFGLGASLISLMIPLSFAIGIGIYYRFRSTNVLKIRTNAKKLEDEFASALFQLGNRLGDGIPAEIAFGKVAAVMDGTVSGKFFDAVNMNIRKLGMGISQAIFDPRSGAITSFPSKVIDSSMKVLIESSRKGPVIAAQALFNISRYIKEIHRVNERLKDLLADTISSMKSQIKFLTPVIAGIVIGITSMVTTILGKLSEQMIKMSTEGEAAGGMGGMTSLFGDGLPTYYFQIIVGIYVVQIVYILTVLSNSIENGSDKLNEDYLVGVNMINGPVLYAVVSIIIILIFNLIAGQIIGATLEV